MMASDRSGYRQSVSIYESGNLNAEVHKSWWIFFKLVLIICIGSLYIGFTSTLMVNWLPVLKDTNRNIVLLRIGAYPLGAALGAFLSFWTQRVFSRK